MNPTCPSSLFKFFTLLSFVFLFTACPASITEPELGEATEDLPVINSLPAAQAYGELFRADQSSLLDRAYPAGQAGNNVYAVDEFVVLYEDEDLENARQDSATLAAEYGSRFREVRSCGCTENFNVRLWRVDSIGGTERGTSGSNTVANKIGKEDDGVSPNSFLFPSRPASNWIFPDYGALASGYSPLPHPAGDNPIKIAVLDSGIDLSLEATDIPGQGKLYFWKNPNEPIVNGTHDGTDIFCFEDDVTGWDFVNNDNNPSDDNSHGTHVAGIIARQLAQNAPEIPYVFMPLKVLDENGVGTTFDAMCAVLYAAYHRADIINASWGFYGDPDPLLERALIRAQNRGSIVVTGAGNDGMNLNEVRHFPGQFGLRDNSVIKSVIVAGGLENNPTRLWESTNFRTDAPTYPGIIAAPAKNITSLVPAFVSSNNLAEKSGTSMAAAYLSALMASYVHYRPDDLPRVIRPNMIKLISEAHSPRYFISNGVQYPYYGFNWFNVPEAYQEHQSEMRVN
ncbi:MAG: S8 family serine peptidase [Bacteroidota bacterium]